MQSPLFDKLPTILHGGDYNPEQWLDRPDILKQDIAWMKQAGINTVTLGVFSWSVYEPCQNEFHFDWLREQIDALYQEGIYTVLATPTGARPAWLDQAYPSALRVQRNGVRNRHGLRHNHCMSSPDFRDRVKIILQQLYAAVGEHPGIILWHISNELGGECMCPLCTARFQQWLKERYHSDIDLLNKAWWTTFWSHRFTDFEQIEPPFANGEPAIHGLNLDWMRFNTWNMTDYMRFEIQTLKELGTTLPFTTNFMCLYPMLDYAKVAKELDLVSWDSYPTWDSQEISRENLAFDVAFDHAQMRGLHPGKPFLLMESTPSLVNWHPFNKLKRPGMHRITSLLAVACGADSVQYFQFRKGRGSFEQYHGAVIDHLNRNDTRVFHDVEALGAELKKLAPLAGSTVQAQAAMIFDQENRWAIKDMAALSKDRGYEAFVREQYAAFTMQDAELDVIPPQADLSPYKLIVLPMLYLLQPGFAERIKQFTASGGLVLATYLTGYVDESTLCYLNGFPGDGLKELFGLYTEEIDTLYPAEENSTTLPFGSGEPIKLTRFCEIVKPQAAETLARYGQDFYQGTPVLTRNFYGKGQAWYMAARADAEGMTLIYGEMLTACGITHRRLPRGVEHHVRCGQEQRFDLYLNFADDPVQLALQASGIDLLTGKPESGVLSLPPLGVAVIQSQKE